MGSMVITYSNRLIGDGDSEAGIYIMFSILHIKILAVIIFTVAGGCYRSANNTSDIQISDEGHEFLADEGLEEEFFESEAIDAEGDVEDEDVTLFCDMRKLDESIQLTFHGGYQPPKARSPEFAFNGSEFGLTWIDSRDTRPDSRVFFNLISRTGTKLMEDMRLSELDSPGHPFITYSSSSKEYAITWIREDGDIMESYILFTRVSDEGMKIGDDILVTESPDPKSQPLIVPASVGYGMLWCDFPTDHCDLKFMRLGPEGDRLSDERMIAQNIWLYANYYDLVFTGSEFAAVWYDGYEYDANVYFERISMDGSPLQEPIKITTEPGGTCMYPTMVFTGSRFAVACVSYRAGDNSGIYLILLSPEGERLSGDIELTDGLARYDYPSLEYLGEELGLLWMVHANDGRDRILFRRFTLDGAQIGEVIEVTDELSTMIGAIPLASTGSEYSMLWEMDPNIFFTRIGCLP
jgi:hypothetical protein